MPNSNIKYAVVGLGASGLSVCEYLHQEQQNFIVCDSRPSPPNLKRFKQRFPGVRLFLGDWPEDDLLAVTSIVLSPGISPKQSLFERCKANGIEIIGDIELFARHARKPVIAITGTNGKSTVTSMIGHMAKACGVAVGVGGNIGKPALSLLHHPYDLYVLELSSFQLDTLYSLKPEVGVLLNISPDHLDRYASFAEYCQSKQRIFHNAKYAVYNQDDALTYPKAPLLAEMVSFGENASASNHWAILQEQNRTYLGLDNTKLLDVQDMKAKGMHNWLNALASLAAVHLVGLSMVQASQALTTYPGLEHRCEWIRAIGSINWYNDSKGTNVGATVSALQGLGEAMRGKIVLIAGGQSKGADFSDLTAPVRDYVRSLIVLGEDGPELVASMPKNIPILYADTMEEAVHLANGQAKPGDSVLLSPACASFDMFNNYAHRGQVFTQCVQTL